MKEVQFCELLSVDFSQPPPSFYVLFMAFTTPLHLLRDVSLTTESQVQPSLSDTELTLKVLLSLIISKVNGEFGNRLGYILQVWKLLADSLSDKELL